MNKNNIKLIKLVLIALLLITVVFVSGCWDARGIEDLEVVTLIGFDKIKQDGIDKWQVSAVMLQPHLSNSGQGGGGGSQSASPEMVWTGTGISLRDAVNDIGKRLPKSMFFGQEKALIIGKSALNENLKDVLELRERYYNSRPRSMVLATKGKAYDILNTKPEAAQSLSVDIEGIQTNTMETLGTGAKVTATQLFGWFLGPDRDAIVPEVETYNPVEKRPTSSEEGDQNMSLVIQNMAIFRGDQLAGWLNNDETEGYLLATHKISKAQIVVTFYHQGHEQAFVINRSDYKITPLYDEDKLSYDVEVDVDGEIYDSKGLLLTSDKIKELQPEISAAIGALVRKTINKAQALGADFIGCSEALYRKEPAAWDEISPNWRQRFSEADINVNVSCKVLNIGKATSEIVPNQ